MSGAGKNPGLIIRLAGTADAGEIARINFLFNQVEESPAIYADRLANPERVDFPILAEINGKVVGLVNLRLLQPVFYAEPYAELTELFVEEPYRRQGIARALLNFAEEMAHKAGANEMLLLTDFYNDGAQKFYHALGYVHHDIAFSKSLQKTKNG